MKIACYRLIVFIFPLFFYSQSIKYNWNYEGNLVFKVSTSITDENKFKKSVVSYKKVFIEGTRLGWKNTEDPTEIKNREELCEKLMTGDFIEKTMFHPNKVYFLEGKYRKDSVIFCSKKVLSEISKKRETLTRETNKRYNPIEIVDIKKFKNIKKQIFGYICYKVEYKFKVSEGEKNYFSENTIYKHEAWVTNKVKIPYNPLFSDDKIISKYFPLEIKETIEGVDGYQTIYEPLNIDLKKD